MESVRRQKQALDNLLKTGKISHITYEKLTKQIEVNISEVEKRRAASINRLMDKNEKLKQLANLLERCSADARVRFSISKTDKERLKNEITAFNLGLESIRSEIQNLERALKEMHAEMIREVLKPEEGFYFYASVGKPLNEVALSLKDFTEKVKTIPLDSVEFHQMRGDFSKWIRNILGDAQLAEAIQKVGGKGEELRNHVMEALNQRLGEPGWVSVAVAKCPECGAESSPRKTWKMAGRPSKEGERLQLTIGYYDCPNCTKKFREVLRKEKIKA
jgi:uncharacterized protein (UPF0212 family)